jgi:hypothetical protein
VADCAGCSCYLQAVRRPGWRLRRLNQPVHNPATALPCIVYDKDNVPEHETFYVVRQDASAPLSVIVTVLNEVPMGTEGLCSFSDPNAAIDFAQRTVLDLRTRGIAVEYVDPPYDLIGGG